MALRGGTLISVGSYEASLTVVDGNGGTDTAMVTVDLTSAAPGRVYTSVDGPLNIGDLKTVTATVLATYSEPVNAVNVDINFPHAAPSENDRIARRAADDDAQ